METKLDNTMDSHWHHTASTIYSDQLQRLQNIRHSFITTPGRASEMYLRIARAIIKSQQPITIWTVLRWMRYLHFYTSLTALSLCVPYALGYGLAAFADLSTNGWQLRHPPHDVVVGFSIVLGTVHLGVVLALSTVLYGDLPLSFPVRVVTSAAFVTILLLVILLGAVMLVMVWTMLQQTMKKLYWDARGHDEAKTTGHGHLPGSKRREDEDRANGLPIPEDEGHG